MKKTCIEYAWLAFLLFGLTTSCAPVKSVNIWKDEAYQRKPQKILIIGIGEQKFMRDFFENNLVQRLRTEGLDATAANKVLPESDKPLPREIVAAKVKELGIDSVLVGRNVSKKEESKLYEGGVYIAPAGFNNGWYPFYYDSLMVFSTPGYAYDADILTIVTNLYDVDTGKLSWSYLSEVRVEGARERAIEHYIDSLMVQLRESRLL